MTPEEHRDLNEQLFELIDLYNRATPAQRYKVLVYTRILWLYSQINRLAPWLVVAALLLLVISLVKW